MFLDATDVSIALPVVARDLHASIPDLQWTVDAYLVTFAAVLLLGGVLAERFGPWRVFFAGLVTFLATSLACALAPTTDWLIAARGMQGLGGGLLVSGSVAVIAATVVLAGRTRPFAEWSGLAGLASAAGPLLGGGVVTALGWRYIFLFNVPVGLVAGMIAIHRLSDAPDATERNPDVPGALLFAVALGALCCAVIERRAEQSVPALVLGFATLGVLLRHERGASHPIVPVAIFRSGQFTSANVTTFAVSCALGTVLFVVVLRLQVSLGYSALEAGAALVPSTFLAFVVSPFAGWLGQRIGVRTPLTVGPMIIAVSMLGFGRVGTTSSYVADILPAAVLFGCGMALTSAPLTAAVLGGVSEGSFEIAAEINNAVARIGGLFAVAVIPAIAGLNAGSSTTGAVDRGYEREMSTAAAICLLGAVAAIVAVRKTARTARVPSPGPFAVCQHPCVVTARAPTSTAQLQAARGSRCRASGRCGRGEN